MTIEKLTSMLAGRKDLSVLEQERRVRAAEILVSHFEVDTEAMETRAAELLKLTKAALVEMILASEAQLSSRGPTIGAGIIKVLMDVECSSMSYEALAWVITTLWPERKTSDKSIGSTVKDAKQKLGLVFPRQRS